MSLGHSLWLQHLLWQKISEIINDSEEFTQISEFLRVSCFGGSSSSSSENKISSWPEPSRGHKRTLRVRPKWPNWFWIRVECQNLNTIQTNIFLLSGNKQHLFNYGGQLDSLNFQNVSLAKFSKLCRMK